MSGLAIGGNVGGTPEASYKDVYEFLGAMEELDPEGTLVVPVSVPDILVERFYPYLDSTPLGLLSIKNPYNPHVTNPQLKGHDLGGVTLVTAIDERGVTSPTRSDIPTRLLLSYEATYPSQEEDDVHKDVYVRRLANIMFKSIADTSVFLEPLSEQQRRAEAAERELGKFGSFLLRHLRARKDPILPTADERNQDPTRETQVGSEELAAVTGLLQALTALKQAGQLPHN